MQSLCHRFVVCFTIIIWSFGVAAAQHDAPPQNHNIKAAKNAAICAAFAKIMDCKPAIPQSRETMAVKILISKIST
jgi:hypothetical protein